jgi:hypothetical protein
MGFIPNFQAARVRMPSQQIILVLIPLTAFAYCQDTATSVIYLHGDGSELANMDIDCDGEQHPAGDGRCGKSQDTQSTTAFKYQVQQYSGGAVSDLNANFIPYVVFGNFGSKAGYTNFHPQSHGIKPLSVMAVVYGDQLVSFYSAYMLHD